jgi:uncharacterized protein (DUF433 family)
MAPVFGVRDAEARRLSFLELVELVVASRFRKADDQGHAIPLERIRSAHDYARKHWNLPYPFASLRLREEGGHILRDFDENEPGGPSLAIDVGGQWTLPGPVREEVEEHLEFSTTPEDPFAIRWHPYGRRVPIVLDPQLAGGQPTVEGRGITIETLQQRHAAGESAASLARDYDLPIRTLRSIFDRAA